MASRWHEEALGNHGAEVITARRAFRVLKGQSHSFNVDLVRKLIVCKVTHEEVIWPGIHNLDRRDQLELFSQTNKLVVIV